MFHYVYVLRSRVDGFFYTGYSSDLKRRIQEHNAGQVPATAQRRPLDLVYYEACRCQADATRRENYLKTAWGKRFLRGRLRNYLMG